MVIPDRLSITEWYNGQSVFVTGASGFLGKVLVYKLLKSCSGIDTIYLLLRPKRGKSSKDRLDQLFSSSIFDELKSREPGLLDKVRMIEGDVAKPYLGMKESDWAKLQECVTIIFNAAASVRFDDSLQKALFTNTRSTKYAILLAKGTKNLKSFVHVSTAYTNCNFAHIKEEVIPIDFDPEKLIAAAEQTEEYNLEILNKKIIGSFPNTYIFTKNIAEVLVYKERHDLPVIIYRPAIIGGSVKEPEPGWCDTFNGLTAVTAAFGKGILRTFITKPDHCFDYITVDTCVNGMIVGAWNRSVNFFNRKLSVEENIVFNATDVKQSMMELTNFFRQYEFIYPLKDQLWRGHYLPTSNTLYFEILNALLHVLPGLVVDGALRMMGKKQMLMRIYRKLYSASQNLKPFTCNNWEFDTRNFAKLKYFVPEKEKSVFFIDSLFQTTKEELLLASIRGGRKLLGEPPEPTKQDIEHAKRLYWIDLILRLTLFGLFLYTLPFKKSWDWSLQLAEEYQEAWNKLEEEYVNYKENIKTN